MRSQILRALFSFFLMALLVTVVLRPKVGLSPLVDLAFIVSVEAVAVALSVWLAKGGPAQAFIRTLILSAAFAFVLVFVLGEGAGLSFDQTFLVLFLVEAGGAVAAEGVRRQGKK